MLGGVDLLVWVYLLLGRSGFWRAGPRLGPPPAAAPPTGWPPVTVIVPARNEAGVLPATLPALLGQDYPGPFRVHLVDDRSTDGTGAVAARLAAADGFGDRLVVVPAEPTPPGWTGKLWAVAQGLAAAGDGAAWVWFTDADIRHGPATLRALVGRALGDDLDLVSVMGRLRAASAAERLLVPAFTYFFAMLFPFRRVADPRRADAAAAGGCLLLRRAALDRSGAPASIRSEVIDDCALARAVQRRPGRDRPARLWLGLATGVDSLRRYEGLGPIWTMVARSAFAQLRHSWLLVAATVAAMLVVFAGPPVATLVGVAALLAGGSPAAAAALGAAAWALMSLSYVPFLRWHGVTARTAPLLPVAALLFTAMTVDSARRARGRAKAAHWR